MWLSVLFCKGNSKCALVAGGDHFVGFWTASRWVLRGW
jgi:hypothetical protein